MSKQLISRSPDLQRLQNEGYDLEVREGYLLVHQVPYVTTERQVARGTLVSTLELAGEVTAQPSQHEAHFAGQLPCDETGTPLAKIINQSQHRELLPGLEVDHFFSSKPTDGDHRYSDYWEKVTSYVAILTSPAQAINPSATAQVFPVIATTEEESVFEYMDTASSRAEIGILTEKLKTGPIAIVGLGGTGSYILDLVAKTPVTEIHLFDGDRFAQHNAFRAPGAASREELETEPQKVNYFANKYATMRRHIVPHDNYVDETNVVELDTMSFVFVALDKNEPKKAIVERLEATGVPFIDVGMGLDEVDGSLRGLLRTTTSTNAKREHLRTRVSLEDASDAGDYDQNIQIAELNALNATLAVIKWKKLLGFYADEENEHCSFFVLEDNHLINDDRA